MTRDEYIDQLELALQGLLEWEAQQGYYNARVWQEAREVFRHRLQEELQ